MKTTITVDQRVLRENKKTGARKPVLVLRDHKHRGANATRCHEVTIDGPSTIIYRPDHPLDCGASAWIETTAKVRVTR